ncbi:hypothetical protein F4859DRAFT_202316 [Xylaria cf. heliscus]|nr:hypothetical protein F4859DRAFT_202316 [Xylaria cf. heliscus]
MAAPASKTIGDLSGKYVLNKTLSDPTDPALTLQGISWVVRRTIGATTVTITVTQYVDESGVSHIDIDQSASGLTSTHEARVLDWTAREHKDWLFGRVAGQSRFISVAELAALVADDDGQARKDGWVDSGFLAEDWIAGEGEAKGPKGEELVLNHVKADAGWVATQVWGFQDVGGERRYVRNVVVAKGEKFESFKMIYDYKPE